MKAERIPPEELSMILGTFEAELRRGTPKMQIYEALAKEYAKSSMAIQNIVRRYRPTVDIAKRTLEAGAMRLAERIVKKASVGEAIDVLSRSSLGVLAPKQEAGSGNIGFFINVQEDSLGAVREGGSIETTPRQALPGAPAHPPRQNQTAIAAGGIIDVEPEPEGVYAKALARSRARLEAAKQAQDTL